VGTTSWALQMDSMGASQSDASYAGVINEDLRRVAGRQAFPFDDSIWVNTLPRNHVTSCGRCFRSAANAVKFPTICAPRVYYGHHPPRFIQIVPLQCTFLTARLAAKHSPVARGGSGFEFRVNHPQCWRLAKQIRVTFIPRFTASELSTAGLISF